MRERMRNGLGRQLTGPEPTCKTRISSVRESRSTPNGGQAVTQPTVPRIATDRRWWRVSISDHEPPPQSFAEITPLSNCSNKFGSSNESVTEVGQSITAGVTRSAWGSVAHTR